MTEDYDAVIAHHYSAYRPPLHQVILAKCLKPGAVYDNGLDIGSGTGQSCIALADFCEKITGAEPSKEMLAQAIGHSKVTYVHFDGINLPFADSSFDLVTFAGSLFYARSQGMLNEVVRVCLPNAIVIAYDFEVLFQRLPFGFHLPEESVGYNHRASFSGLEMNGLRETDSFVSDYQLGVSAENLAHLLLSAGSFYNYFSERYTASDPFGLLVRELSQHAIVHSIGARLYATVYKVGVK
ncbi:class I SAM-dependent methyltransferase [uncultured Imperialibacter sp.]|uniref:class I SAM-dependent methyltransferase n=1 Tax=uncultured Imperialibacter sp. TaxID=1672639 RepID=UPI0030DBC981|tara:strand:+ start:6651 stop:7367 length:717 start_codon:yes stop_codon:yes gene_type:complete